jgi:acyl-CoA reductase-like NAD-dependent aldehyde dehydrogenase
MADVGELLILHRELATRLGRIEHKLQCNGETVPLFEVTEIDDPDLIAAVAAAIHQLDGGDWANVTPAERTRVLRLAECAIAAFLNELANWSLP